MFEKVVLCTSKEGPALTIGKVAELSLFYQNIHLVLDYRNLRNLIKSAGAGSFLSFLGRENITATYFTDTLGTRTIDTGPIKTHDFVAITYAGSETKGKVSGYKGIILHSFEQSGCSGKDAKDYSEQFCELVPRDSWINDTFVKGGAIKVAQDILSEPDYIHEAVRKGLIRATEEEVLPRNLSFNVLLDKGTFKIISDIDFEEINKKNKAIDPLGGNISEALLINSVLTAQAEMLLSSHHGGELFTSDLTSSLIRMRYKSLIKKVQQEEEQRQTFSEVISESRSISEAIDRGEKTFDDFLLLLDEAEKFKTWLKDTTPDENIVKKYIKEISNKGWAGTFPVKVVRYLITLASGVGSPTAGGIVSALDTFLVDKISRGWKPSHFVDGPYKKFLG